MLNSVILLLFEKLEGGYILLQDFCYKYKQLFYYKMPFQEIKKENFVSGSSCGYVFY